MTIVVVGGMPHSWSVTLFEAFHSAHVFLSALATAGMYRLYAKGKLWPTIAIGYFGSIGIATLSDCLIPYLGESLLGLPNRGIYLGFVESPWLVNLLASAGIAVGCLWSKTKFPHAGHVLLSTGASLFHVTMALGEQLSAVTWIVIFIFLFLSVWLPCCVSDIVFPLLFCREGIEAHTTHQCSCPEE